MTSIWRQLLSIRMTCSLEMKSYIQFIVRMTLNDIYSSTVVKLGLSLDCLWNQGFQRIFRNCKIAVFGAWKIAEKHILTVFQSTAILHPFQEHRQLVNDILTLTTDRFQIKEQTCKQKRPLYPICQIGFQPFCQLHHVAVVLLINQLNELCRLIKRITPFLALPLACSASLFLLHSPSCCEEMNAALLLQSRDTHPTRVNTKKNSHPDVNLNTSTMLVNNKRFFCIFDNCLFHLFLFL